MKTSRLPAVLFANNLPAQLARVQTRRMDIHTIYHRIIRDLVQVSRRGILEPFDKTTARDL